MSTTRWPVGMAVGIRHSGCLEVDPPSIELGRPVPDPALGDLREFWSGGGICRYVAERSGQVDADFVRLCESITCGP
jgi:hypothetical protein